MKIPTLYLDDPAMPGIPCPVVQGGCHWVISDHGQATRKYDGLCLAYLPMRQSRHAYGTRPLDSYPAHYQPVTEQEYQNDPETRRGWFVRETHPHGIRTPPGFMRVDMDAANVIGWRLASYTGHHELVESVTKDGQFEAGTYELVGPSIKGNPHGFDSHQLIAHRDAEILPDVPTRFDDLIHWLIDHPEHAGVVWRHQDGRMAQMERDAALRWQKARG